MKIKKRISILVAFMLLFMITFPVTGAFAAENSEQKTNSQQESTVKQKSSKVAAKTTDQKEKSNGVVKAASTENEAYTEEDSETETTADQTEINSEQETTNQPKASENSDNQEDNAEEGNNASGENNTQEETNDAEENNAPEGDNASEGENASEEDKDSEENNAAEESENEWTPADDGTVPGDENKSTQIHLHIDKCVNSVETAFVQVNGQWEEMTNPGSSPLYKSFDDGEFIKDDVTAFKLIFTTGEELVIPVSEVRVGVEAEGSVNYWLDICELPVEEPSEPGDSEDTDETMNILSMIRILIDETPRPIEKVTLVMMSGKRIDLERINELFSLTLTEEIQLELIRGLEITSNGETKLILLSQIESLEIVDSVLTLQLSWDMEGEMVEEESEEAESDEDTNTTAPGNNSGSGNTSDGTTNKQLWNGEVLPQTGESSRTMFYVLGFLIAAGGVMLRFRNPLRN
ncbi:LPXTG cell wall anchor domain-containing protein [Bacillus sp. ISL-37]|uniref:LPXTG cell wall anchor domain-containing protein n=1 Tax=Bacillus sp. ISL-37 TaxID=2819123 RepID=UPI001BE903F0|nr:LPXTG cell wall anchor domain-containing protein [Bacillus sp. ISL-37]MBT2683818.1 LPXTG cell wall anchor domain-containing protein [Bacillus sp. ISL-37]